MTMSSSLFERYDIFKNMHPKKLQVMKDLADEMEGKNIKDAAPMLMKAASELKRHDLSFSPEETAILLQILTKDMSPQDKAKVEMMQRVVKEQSKKR